MLWPLLTAANTCQPPAVSPTSLHSVPHTFWVTPHSGPLHMLFPLSGMPLPPPPTSQSLSRSFGLSLRSPPKCHYLRGPSVCRGLPVTLLQGIHCCVNDPNHSSWFCTIFTHVVFALMCLSPRPDCKLHWERDRACFIHLHTLSILGPAPSPY